MNLFIFRFVINTDSYWNFYYFNMSIETSIVKLTFDLFYFISYFDVRTLFIIISLILITVLKKIHKDLYFYTFSLKIISWSILTVSKLSSFYIEKYSIIHIGDKFRHILHGKLWVLLLYSRITNLLSLNKNKKMDHLLILRVILSYLYD